MNIFYLFLEILGILVFTGFAFLISKKKKDIQWLGIGILFTINVFFAWFFLTVPAGRMAIQVTVDGFASLVSTANEGVSFVFGDALTSTSEQIKNGVTTLVFFSSALLPIIVIVPLFDILTYIKVLPFITRWVGKGLAIITRQGKFESFYAILMMFLGNAEAIAASRYQIKQLKKHSEDRIVTIAMMSMSCVTASLIGAYCSMLPGEYIITAIPLNVINSLMITSILNPVKIPKEQDVICDLYEKGEEREPFFSYLGNSIVNSGRLVLIICANVIAFVGLAAVINLILGIANPLIHTFIDWDLSLQNILGLIMYIPAMLLGNEFGSPETMQLAQAMGTKFVTNEFVVMQQMSPIIGDFNAHFQCVISVFLTSFANFSTIGLIMGCFKGSKAVPKNVPYLFASGILVSLMSAAIAGLFVW